MRQTYTTGLTVSVGLTIADVNGDGKPDLVVTGCSASCSPGNVAVLLGNGGRKFQTWGALQHGRLGGRGAGRGRCESRWQGRHSGGDACQTVECTGVGSLGVMLGKGDGTFEPVVTYGSGGFEASAIAIADVNGDG